MMSQTLHCPDCGQLLLRNVTFEGIVDLAKAKVCWQQKCAACKSMVNVEILPRLGATGNGDTLAANDRSEPRIRSFHR